MARLATETPMKMADRTVGRFPEQMADLNRSIALTSRLQPDFYFRGRSHREFRPLQIFGCEHWHSQFSRSVQQPTHRSLWATRQKRRLGNRGDRPWPANSSWASNKLLPRDEAAGANATPVWNRILDAHIGRWLTEVANARIYTITHELM
jgi:hypothetical protein